MELGVALGDLFALVFFETASLTATRDLDFSNISRESGRLRNLPSRFSIFLIDFSCPSIAMTNRSNNSICWSFIFIAGIRQSITIANYVCRQTMFIEELVICATPLR